MPGRAKPGQPKSTAKQTFGTRHGNGAGKGDGWGGSAKGASASRIKPGDPDGIQAMRNDAEVLARRAARLEATEDTIFDLSQGATREETRLSAAIAYRNQFLGMPTQRQELSLRNVNADDLTDDELAAIAAGRGGAASGPAGGQD